MFAFLQKIVSNQIFIIKPKAICKLFHLTLVHSQNFILINLGHKRESRHANLKTLTSESNLIKPIKGRYMLNQINSSFSSSESNVSDEVCCSWTADDESTISVCSFWLEGVSIMAVGIPGLIGNGLSILVLAGRSDMAKTNVFHLLLVRYYNFCVPLC